MIGIGYYSFAAEIAYRIKNSLFGAGNNHRAYIGLLRAAPDLNDHGSSSNVGQRFIR